MGTENNNKRIAKNTAFLYFRMLLLTAISLYTVKITLNALGVVDYGIYNVVASVVASLSFLNGTLTSATQRFLSFHLGKNDYKAYSNTFSMLLMGYIFIGISILILGEIFGIFFIEDFLKIPMDRINAAKWVFQTALFSFVLNMLIVPFSSSIVANERMEAFAYISILDGILRLLLVFLLFRYNQDRLIYYGVLCLMEMLIMTIVYISYCLCKFPYCRIKLFWDKAMFKELTSYTGWNLFGSISGVLITQGQNILLNMFFGPLVNTAKGIGDKINSVVNSFSTNFYMAVNPQIIKSYASGDRQRMLNLGLTSSRLSFFMLLCLSFPLIISMRNLLCLWLGEEAVSVTMVHFSQLTLLFCMVNSLEQPITQMIRATGRIKDYQLRVGILTIMYIPIAAVTLYYGASPISTMVVLIVLYSIVQIVRINIAHRQIGLNIKEYLRKVLYPILKVFGPCIIWYWGIDIVAITDNWYFAFIKFFGSMIIVFMAVWLIGISRHERQYILGMIKNKIK